MSAPSTHPRYKQCLSCAVPLGGAVPRAAAVPCGHDSYCAACLDELARRDGGAVCVLCQSKIQGALY